MKSNTTKQRIFDAAMRLFAEKSYKDISLRDIATAVGIKAPSIYNYYASKEEIMDDLLDTYRRHLIKFKESSTVGDKNLTPQERLHKLVFNFPAEDIRSMRYITKIVYKEYFWNEKAKNIVCEFSLNRKKEDFINYFEQLAAEGFHISENVNYYAEILTRISLSYTLNYALMDPAENHDQMVMETCDFVLQLATEQ